MTCDQFRSMAYDVLHLAYEERMKYVAHFEECDYCQEEVMKVNSAANLKPEDLTYVIERAVEDALKFYGKQHDTELAIKLRSHIRQEIAKDD